MPLLVLECLYLLLDIFGGPQVGFFGFTSGEYLEGGVALSDLSTLSFSLYLAFFPSSSSSCSLPCLPGGNHNKRPSEFLIAMRNEMTVECFSPEREKGSGLFF